MDAARAGGRDSADLLCGVQVAFLGQARGLASDGRRAAVRRRVCISFHGERSRVLRAAADFQFGCLSAAILFFRTAVRFGTKRGRRAEEFVHFARLGMEAHAENFGNGRAFAHSVCGSDDVHDSVYSALCVFSDGAFRLLGDQRGH